ncbi:MAG: class I SAM-dependent methyltransferase, partial [Deltaproteobacteria bacterium]|nr:class I SAM-dependent methyltransferase [Deltaproteobacteria bacterium]
QGSLFASTFRFPYEKETFDVVLLVSVFTHLLRNDMQNYFSEISRVLRPRGRCLITFFLFNETQKDGIDANRREIEFKYSAGRGERVADKNEPEGAVAYDEYFIRELYAESDFIITEPILYGFQDIVVAVKKPL